jgi:hypothetical protein
VPFEVMTDARTVAKSWKKFIRLECPHCEDRHAISFKELYINGVLASLTAEHTGTLVINPTTVVGPRLIRSRYPRSSDR